MQHHTSHTSELLIKLLLCVTAIGCVLGSIYLIAYLPYRHTLFLGTKAISRTETSKHDLFTESVRSLIGNRAPEIKKSSFTHFPLNKKKGVIRIGCFGCSFTFGSEVGQMSDFPSQLQERFRRSGVTNVEVLNFGAPGYGFGQSFMVYEELGKKYDLDQLIIGPVAFYDHRELTFHNPVGPFEGMLLHARYIITRDGIKLLPVLGTTREEQHALYYRFIPKLYYLRYDMFPPAIIRSINRTGWTSLANPFYYYKGSSREEAYIIYQELLTRLSRDPSLKHIYVINHDPKIVALCQKLGLPKLTAAYIRAHGEFPNTAPQGHYSHQGNKDLADALFQWIRYGHAPAKNIHTIKVAAIRAQPSQLKIEPLSFYKHSTLMQGKHRIASLIQYSNCGLVPCDMEKARESFTKTTLLIVQQKDLMNAIWVETDQQLKGQEKVRLRVFTKGTRHDYALGTVRLLAPHIGTFILRGNSEYLSRFPGKSAIRIEEVHSVDGKNISLKNNERWEIWVSDQLLMSSRPQNRTEYLRPMVMKNDHTEIRPGIIYLQLDARTRIPLARLARQKV